ncbi:hypothetical protein BB561_006085 [Smittium simulii]|uniref:DNA topoisomerase I n=1 Tax=Smittium simulii TaxID=133385 RepID=A0A2T9Y6R7_9FUNG|nr:hypothetical protein BB561_006085 [Smittium simulii]
MLEDDKPLLAVKTEEQSSGEEISLLDIKNNLGSRAATKPRIIANSSTKRKIKPEYTDSDSSNDDLPLLAQRVSKSPKVSSKKLNKPTIKSSLSNDDFESDVALSARVAKTKPRIKTETKRSKSAQKPLSKLLTIPKKPVKSTASSTKSSVAGDNDSDEYKWWLESNGDGSIKWNNLSHNGVLFPPEYEPHGQPIFYNGKPVYLEPEIEELVGFYAALLETDHAKNKIFQKNFFKEFTEMLDKSEKNYGITDISKCDFSSMHRYFNKLKEEKKLLTKDEKQVLKDEKLKIDNAYGTCILDGRVEKVGNFRIEPPGLFRGRGAHPKAGCYKKRVLPEQITINIGKDAVIPSPPQGHSWGKVIHDQTVTWLAMWKENINDSIKYVFLAAGSSIKGQSDLKKYEKARTLKTCVSKIRKDYTSDLVSNNIATKQRSTAMYLIDRLALRAGNEKGEDQADTVGCCSLRYEHIELAPPKKVVFDFLGKDSIRYYNEVEVTTQVFKNLQLFKKKAKSSGNMIFDLINPADLNKHLSNLMPGLSAKVFRTYNASFTFQKQLEATPKGASIPELLLSYNRANREVAILCNHQKAVTKSFDDQMHRMTDKINTLKYTRQRYLDQLLSVQPKANKIYPNLFNITYNDFSKEWLIKYHLESNLKQELKECDLKEANIIKGKYTPENLLSETAIAEKIAQSIEKMDIRIHAAETVKVDKDENKTTALGTSKINYIDPRISIAWCKKYDVPIDKIFNRTLKEKFKWALEVDSNWTF